MGVELNHTIIPAKDKWVSAKFLADILNLEAGPEWGHFVPVKTANGVTLDFDTREEFRPGHYAFLLSDAEFDAAFARIRARGVRYYADPRRTKPGEINHLHGGRGVYFEDPNGHVMEIITHPYATGPSRSDRPRVGDGAPHEHDTAWAGWHVDAIDTERCEGIEDRLDYGRRAAPKSAWPAA